MSLQFSRSLRSLKIDGFRASRIGLILAILNILALIGWFFIAKVTLYETSSAVNLTEDGRVVASFESDSMKRIQRGQAGLLRLDLGKDQRMVTLPLTVFDKQEGGDQVEFLVQSNELATNFPAGKLSGQVEVEVEQVTPAELVLRTSGKYFSNNQVPLAPQAEQATPQP